MNDNVINFFTNMTLTLLAVINNNNDRTPELNDSLASCLMKFELRVE